MCRAQGSRFTTEGQRKRKSNRLRYVVQENRRTEINPIQPVPSRKWKTPTKRKKINARHIREKGGGHHSCGVSYGDPCSQPRRNKKASCDNGNLSPILQKKTAFLWGKLEKPPKRSRNAFNRVKSKKPKTGGDRTSTQREIRTTGRGAGD